MARKINQGFNGMQELQAEMSKLVADIAGKGQAAGLALKEVLRDAAEPIADDARRLVHVRTGETKMEIFADRGDPNKPSVIVGVDTKSAPQANWEEFGTVKHPPHPFMRPAIEMNRTKVRQIIADGVARIVDEYR